MSDRITELTNELRKEGAVVIVWLPADMPAWEDDDVDSQEAAADQLGMVAKALEDRLIEVGNEIISNW